MKKKTIILLVMILFLLVGCGNSKNTLKEITIDELKQKITNKDSFIAYFDNGNNKTLQDKLEKVLEDNNLTGFYVDTTKINDDEKLALEPNVAYEEPSTVFIIEGNDPSKLTHVTNSDITTKELTIRLKDLKYIK